MTVLSPLSIAPYTGVPDPSPPERFPFKTQETSSIYRSGAVTDFSRNSFHTPVYRDFMTRIQHIKILRRSPCPTVSSVRPRVDGGDIHRSRLLDTRKS